MKKVLIFTFVFFSIFIFSQQQKNLSLNKYKTSVLSDSIKETSGLNFFENRLFTFNDSGNSSDIFEIEKSTGKILKTFKTGLKNTDWEALANDGKYFYIGDFGNNAGTRKDLRIYKIPFENRNIFRKDSVKIIPFFYPEQKDFTPKNLNNDFDAEAMIFLNGKIHIFTKEWASKSTSHYVVNPENSENQSAQKIETFKTNFVVTDASYVDGKLYLVGYTKGTDVFLQIFQESEPGIFFKNNSTKFYLGSAFSVGQIEGISVDENGAYLSSEAFHSPFGVKKQSFYFIPTEKLN